MIGNFARHTAPEPDIRFVVDDFEPAYVRVQRAGGLEARRRRALEELEDCCACPRNCHVNRLEGAGILAPTTPTSRATGPSATYI